MSRFYASIQGGKSEATRQGTPNSGIQGHVRGWGLGVAVIGSPDLNDVKNDTFDIYMTTGSNNKAKHVYIGYVSKTKEGNEFHPA